MPPKETDTEEERDEDQEPAAATDDTEADRTRIDAVEELSDEDILREEDEEDDEKTTIWGTNTIIEPEEDLEKLDEEDILPEKDEPETDEEKTAAQSERALRELGEAKTQKSLRSGVDPKPLKRLSAEIRSGAFDKSAEDKSRPTLLAGPEQADNETLLRGSEKDIPVFVERPEPPQTLIQDNFDDPRTLIDEHPELQRDIPHTKVSEDGLPPIMERPSGIQSTRVSEENLPPVGDKSRNHSRPEFFVSKDINKKETKIEPGRTNKREEGGGPKPRRKLRGRY